MISKILAFSFLIPFVSAHGYLRSITIDGQEFTGAVPNSGNFDSAVRIINDVSPVKGATNGNINCGAGAQQTNVVADANPGSTLEFAWAGGDGSNWPHNIGPMLTYLASCGDTACNQFDSSQAQWFKIDEAGLKDGSSDTWFQNDLFTGGTYSMSLPSNLAAGGYLVRHEIIGLHIADTEGGAEFYPSCSQINVGGSETGAPNDNDLVSFPGAYSDTDPGILFNAFAGQDSSYQFPGPAIADLAGGNGNQRKAVALSASDSSSETSTTVQNVAATDSASATLSSSESEVTTTASSSESSMDCSDSISISASATASIDATAVTAAAASDAAGSTVMVFTVTETIPLKARETSAQFDVRPHRVSRIMRDLLN